MKKWLLILLPFGMVILFLLKRRKIMDTIGFSPFLKSLLEKHEGFHAQPYEDYKQWSWGFGTKVPDSVYPGPKPAKTINKAQAFIESTAHINKDYNVLVKKATRSLSAKQWAALLSFSYNLGIGTALKILDDYNANGVTSALKKRWNAYVMAGGERLPGLVKRRAEEWDLFSS